MQKKKKNLWDEASLSKRPLGPKGRVYQMGLAAEQVSQKKRNFSTKKIKEKNIWKRLGSLSFIYFELFHCSMG